MTRPAARAFTMTAEAAPVAEVPWSALVPEEQWAALHDGAAALERNEIPFLLHGALALAHYTGHWRNTKDIDFVLRAAQHERAIAALRDAGFADYFEQEAYDRSWIFRGFKGGVILDLIWALPNHRVEIDDAWFERSVPLCLCGRPYAVVPAEELVRVKLYVMQRERCDWVDVLNVLASTADRLDWRRLVHRMGRDLPLLHGALAIFNWLSPGRAAALPAWVRQQFALPEIADDDPAAMEERRVRLFDSRPWFAAHQPIDQPLER